jgi:hypothetical protein
MPLGLRPGLSFGIADGRAIFLDSHNDRYLCLPAPLNARFLSLLGDPNAPAPMDEALRSLLRLDAPDPIAPAGITAAKTDLLPIDCPVAPGPAISMCLAQAIGRLGPRRSLGARLAGVAQRQRHVRETLPEQEALERASRLIAAFASTRFWFDTQDRCLDQSIILSHVLAAHGLRSSLVFGVRPRPFSAHCWLQRGRVVLNDRLEMIKAYVPVRVVA